jgi:hypothetical protein
MVLYECKSCNYKTELKSNYTRHIKSKKHGRKTDPNYDILKELASLEEKEPEKNQKEPEKNQKEPEKNQDGKNFKCDYCDNYFNTFPSKRRHELHRCTEIPVSLQHKQDKAEWKKEKKVLYKQIDALIKKAGNTTTNNLNLNSYGNEDLSHITDNFKTGLLKGPYGMIPKMIEAVHFSDDKPENKNISLTNKKDNRIKIFKNGKWEYCKKTEILEDILNNNYYLLDSHYDDMGKELLNDVQKYQYSTFKDEFQNGELDKDTKEDIDILLLNSN